MFAEALLFIPLALAIQVPHLSGPVVDDASLLSAGDRQTVERELQRLNDSGKVQMAILTTPDLQGLEIEQYGIAVADQWKLGKKGTDQGLILIIAPKDRRMRLEVGRGLEGDIPDITAKRILADDVTPYFKDQRYRDGLLVAVARVGQQLGVEGAAPVERPVTRQRKRGTSPILILLMVLGYFLFSGGLFRRRRHGMFYGGGGGWGGGGGFGGGGGGGFGGGGFSGGGGGFGGGGSSSSW